VNITEVDVTRPKRSEVDILRSGEDWSSYSREYDRQVAAEFQAAEHQKQADAEQARLKALSAAYELQRKSEANWAVPVASGVDINCRKCRSPSRIFGHYLDGTDSTRVDDPHLFVDLEGRNILTFACRECHVSNAVCLGRIAPDPPVNYTSWNSLVKRFGEASA
jgi:hypothetical protein